MSVLEELDEMKRGTEKKENRQSCFTLYDSLKIDMEIYIKVSLFRRTK